ncbi:hypothetical protein BH11PLA2_BH11PLA2_23330 [soil metagenome]
MANDRNDLDAAAAKLESAAIHLSSLSANLMNHAGQGSGLGPTVNRLTGVTGGKDSGKSEGGISKLLATIFPNQSPSFAAGQNVLSKGRDLFDSLFGSGRASSKGSDRQPFGPNTGPTSPASGQDRLNLPNPLPVTIVGGASEAAGRAAQAATKAFQGPSLANVELDASKLQLLNPKAALGNAAAGGATSKAAAGARALAGGEAAAGAGARAATGAATAAAGVEVAAVAGPAGAAIAAGSALLEFKKRVEDGTRAQLDLNRALADLSPAMANVFAHAEARDAFRMNEVGNRAAGSARMLSDLDQSRKDNTKELDLAVQNIGNTLGAIANGVAIVAAFPFNQLAKLVNKWLFESDDDEGFFGFAEGFEKQAKEEQKNGDERRSRLDRNNDDDRRRG